MTQMAPEWNEYVNLRDTGLVEEEKSFWNRGSHTLSMVVSVSFHTCERGSIKAQKDGSGSGREDLPRVLVDSGSDVGASGALAWPRPTRPTVSGAGRRSSLGEQTARTRSD